MLDIFLVVFGRTAQPPDWPEHRPRVPRKDDAERRVGWAVAALLLAYIIYGVVQSVAGH